jgi:hypothetical protein
MIKFGFEYPVDRLFDLVVRNVSPGIARQLAQSMKGFFVVRSCVAQSSGGSHQPWVNAVLWVGQLNVYR